MRSNVCVGYSGDGYSMLKSLTVEGALMVGVRASICPREPDCHRRPARARQEPVSRVALRRRIVAHGACTSINSYDEARTSRNNTTLISANKALFIVFFKSILDRLL
jgi:hypothetical protein